ncbi:lipopolysaccharide biosynthesis protein [Salipiger profundus]|uniref:lipopolysaccharide biosynthesis protein n=1 Tax=Salipiger profundus TaxID=1229727 RepID=UPI0008E7DA01|nr:hypothetical protein [Salipiger profundus]SFD73985.1 Membrane protein involved in the export of O-antigen and teichoic acid [Salipiger profundus]
MSDQETLTRRNLARSRGIVLVAFLVNAGLNLLLLGVLTQWGGLDLVGQWSFLNAILLIVLLADFGITNSLSYRIGRDGVISVAPHIRTLVLGIFALAVVCSVVGAFSGHISEAWGPALTITILAALAELASNWLIAIRMGQHEQYWFNAKTVLRVVLQTAIALLLYQLMPGQAPFAFALAFLLARCAELLLAWFMVRRDLLLRGPWISPAQIIELTKGFGLLSVTVKGLDPLSRLMISAFAGPVALGVFTVARRIPAVIDQSVSEALRALLPGMSRLRDGAERTKARTLLSESVAGQLIMIAPPMVAIAIHSDLLFRVWLGQTSIALTITMSLLLVGTFINAVTRPFFWTVQAFGDASKLARLTFLRVGSTLLVGGSLLWLNGSIEIFGLIFALSQILAGLLAFRLTNSYDLLARQVIQRLPLVRIVLFIVAVAFLNLLLIRTELYLAALPSLLVVVFSNAVFVGPVGIYLLRGLKKAVA